MIYLWATSLLLINTLWLGLVVLGLPGNWLMVATTAVVVWWQWGTPATTSGPAAVNAMFSLATLITVVVLAIIGEVLEFVAGLLGSKRAGGSRAGAMGALGGGIVGAIAGTPLLPIVGSLIGAAVGAFAGALVLELWYGRKMRESVQSGVGAGVGRLVGTGIKLAVGVAIWLVVAVATFWP